MHIKGAHFYQPNIETALNQGGYDGFLALEAGLKERNLARFIFKVYVVKGFHDGGEE